MHRITGLAAAAAVALLGLAGCGGGDAAPQNTAPTSAPTSARIGDAADPQAETAFQKQFGKDNPNAKWFDKVQQTALDGQAVIITADLPKKSPEALTICEAAHAAAKAAKIEFVSVAVRTPNNGTTLASRNEASGDTACKA
ncbi:hypothetical protein [Crossiella sp. NPDC003009]